MNERLGKQQWIEAALRALAAHGIDAVRIERLAAALQITKGSFYWHFKDRKALLAALLEAWKARATDDVIALVEARGGNAPSRLRTLAMTVFSADGRLEQQIRAWAANDPLARAAQDEIDARRIGFIATLFQLLELSPGDAQARARFAYNSLIGQFARGASSAPDPSEIALIVRLLSAPAAASVPAG